MLLLLLLLVIRTEFFISNESKDSFELRRSIRLIEVSFSCCFTTAICTLEKRTLQSGLHSPVFPTRRVFSYRFIVIH